jgi:hypothetical protein
MKGITQKHYQALILANIDNNDYSDIELLTDDDKIIFATVTVQSEMGGITQKHCQDWLQGLVSACAIPFDNVDIIHWAEGILGRELTEEQQYILCYKEYWNNAANALSVLINQSQKA